MLLTFLQVNRTASMKILLVGEYSRLHNSLKEGLYQNGIEAVIFGFSDGFKNFPVDLKLEKKWDRGFRKKIKILLYIISGFDFSSFLIYRQFIRNKSFYTGFDIVQLINENSFGCQPYFEKKILQFLFKNNKKVFLLSCGDDYINVKYNFDNPSSKSIVQPYLMGKIKNKHFLGVLKFRTDAFKRLHEFIYENISGVIASDIDYHIPLIGNTKYSGLIPNPINIDKIPYLGLDIPSKIIIFLGINTDNYYKKGSDYFEEALEVIKHKYGERVQIIITRSVPYATYIHLYDSAHILLDQTFSMDQGYNALEAMAKGKVVFTGAGDEFTVHYGLSEKVAINALADRDYLAAQLSHLIEYPEEIIKIGKEARAFVEDQHDYTKITKKYLEIWNTY